MGRLKKVDVERMLERYEQDPLDALTVALRTVLDRDGDFTALIDGAGFEPARRAALLSHDPAALDALLVDLNELRALPR